MAGRRSLEEIEVEFREARQRNDSAPIARLRNEEACVVLLTLLGRLAADESFFIHEVAIPRDGGAGDTTRGREQGET